MKRRGGEEESRKLNDQLTGSVETKLAGGHQKAMWRGDGGRGTVSTGAHKQTINTVTPEGKTGK